MYYLKLSYHLLFSITIYGLPFTIYHLNLLPSYPDTQHRMSLTLRQAIYYSLLASSGGTQSGNHKCSLLYYDVF